MTSMSSHHHQDREAAPGRLRIGFVADDLYPGFGGQASATQGHIEALVARGHRIRAVAGREASQIDPPPGVELRRVPAWQPGETQTNFALPSPSAVAWLIGWADVVHINTPTPLALVAGLAARASRIPCVMGVHTQLESSSLHFDRGRRVVEAAVGTWFRTLFSVADALTAPTSFAARASRAFTDTPVRVVSNGVRLPSHVPTRAEARARLAPELAVADGTRVLTYVGRLAPEKRPGDLLELIERLPGDVVLWVAGTGPLSSSLKAEANQRGLQERVRFLGWVSEERKHLLLAAADLFVMPSPTELQSIATLEAMARGCAVAAADHATSAVPSVVRDVDGGVVYPPEDPAAAAAHIEALLADERALRTYKEHARRGAERHELDRSAEALEALYVALIEGRTLEDGHR